MKTIKTKKELESVIKKLPKDFSQHCVRDMSLLSSYAFGRTHMRDIPRTFGLRFSSWFFYNDKGLITFFRSQSEYDKFSKGVGERAKKEPMFAEKLSGRLRKLTDRFMTSTAGKKFRKNSFMKMYSTFFTYHQAVYWGGDYLSRTDHDNSRRIVNMLDSAYRYNEMVFPGIERYFKKLGIGNLLPDEIGKKNIPGKDRGLLFIGADEYILPDVMSRILYNRVKKKEIADKEVKGITVCPGKCRGRVRLIVDLNTLDSVRKGDILVTHMTRPQFNNQIKNAKAIVTDEGGMLSHASIVSREFNIPCVVGTRNATSILKEGDMIEVDADRGVVKIIEERQDGRH